MKPSPEVLNILRELREWMAWGFYEVIDMGGMQIQFSVVSSVDLGLDCGQ